MKAQTEVQLTRGVKHIKKYLLVPRWEPSNWSAAQQ